MNARRWQVSLGGAAPEAVSLTFEAGWKARARGQELDIRVEQVDEDGVVHAVVDGERLRLRIERGPDGSRCLVPLAPGGQAAPLPTALEVRSEGSLALHGRRAQAPEVYVDPVVRAPITGVVHALRVEVGQTVRAGETVAVLEAMKMETELKSTVDGIVSATPAPVGTQVRTGDAIIEVEPASHEEAGG